MWARITLLSAFQKCEDDLNVIIRLMIHSDQDSMQLQKKILEIKF